MATELKDDATHEDIQAYVEEVVAAQETRDGEQLAADTDQPGERPSAADTAEVSDSATTAQGGENWLDDDLKAELAAYGIDEKELEDFTSREEVDRALRFLDKKALEAGRQAQADKPTRDERGRFQKEEPEESPESQDGKFEITLNKDVYDDGLVDELTRMRDHYESRLEALEARFLESDAQAEEQRFDSLVDSLGHADLFGTTGKETKAELARRQELFVAWKGYQEGMAKLGRQVDAEALLGPLAKMVFPNETDKKLLKAQTRRIARQANGRQGGGATRPTEPQETLRDEMRRFYQELERSSP